MVDHLLLSIVIGIVFVGQLKACWPFLGRGRPKRRKKSKAAKKQSQTTAPTKRPSCSACVADQEAQEKAMATPDEPPPMIEQTRGRPRSVDISSHFCPEKSYRNCSCFVSRPGNNRLRLLPSRQIGRMLPVAWHRQSGQNPCRLAGQYLFTGLF